MLLDNPNSIEAGISFDENDGVNILRFHFLDYEEGKILNQRTKSMYLNEENTKELINELSKLTFNTSDNSNLKEPIYSKSEVKSIIQFIYSEFAELPLKMHTTQNLRTIIEQEVENHPLKPIKIFK